MNIAAALHTAWFTRNPDDADRWGVPVYIYGPPGQGKTTRAKQVALSDGFAVINVAVHLSRPEDFKGLAVPDMAERAIARLPDGWIRDARANPISVVILDEINYANDGTQKACLKGLHENQWGDEVLPGTVRYALTGNPAEESGGAAQDVIAALSNRLVHLRMSRSPADWTRWRRGMVEAPADPLDTEAEQARVAALWPEFFARASATVAAFIDVRPGLLYQKPAEGDPKLSGPWPSDRSWDVFTHVYATCLLMQAHPTPGRKELILDDETMAALLAGTIGEGATTEFLSWVAAADLGTPTEYLTGARAFAHYHHRIDRTHAVLGACALHLRSFTGEKADRIAQARVLWGMLGAVAKVAVDLTVQPVEILIAAGLLVPCKDVAYPVVDKLGGSFAAMKEGA